MHDSSYQIAPELPGFHGLYDKLLRADLAKQLPVGELAEPIVISNDEVRQLVGYASILSTFSESGNRSLAYEIATRLIEVQEEENPLLVAAADLILSCVGNFPGRHLLRERYTTTTSSIRRHLYDYGWNVLYEK